MSKLPRRPQSGSAKSVQVIDPPLDEPVDKTEADDSPRQGEGPLEDDIRKRPPGQISLIVLATLAVFAVLKVASAVLFPIALALLLHFLFSPFVRLLERRRIPESLGAAVVVLGAGLVASVATFFLMDPAAEWIADAPNLVREAKEQFRELTAPLKEVTEATSEVKEETKLPDGAQPVKVQIEEPPAINTETILTATQEFAASVTIVVVLLYLMLAMGHRTLNSVVELMPSNEDKRGIVELVRDIEQGVSRYLLTVTAINIGLGVAIGTAMALLKLPSPVLLGIMAGTLNFIPFLGGVAGVGIVFLIALVEVGPPATYLAPLLYLAINTVEGNVVTPMILGRSMKLNPVVVFFSIILWGWLWGIGGILIAVPLLGVLKIFCEHFERFRPMARLLSG